MCICLNCYYLSLCKQYHMIETNHFEDHITIEPRFFPIQTILKITIGLKRSNTSKIKTEWDVTECLSFRERPANWTNYID
uniref:Ycf34 n=1 Tax=Haramonas pauciplastida TaxID=478668 RepID=UPI0021152FDF|nr:Ycf34 [Haramonas pauciplastida]UTE94933.1 Ycf34 [Haramonas pauciplastida]